MYALAYLLYLGLAVYVCRWLAKRGTQSRKKTVFCTALGVVLVLLPHWDVILGIPTMRKLCAEEGGLQVREEVKFPLSSVMVVSRYGAGLVCLPCYKMVVMGLASETYAEIYVRNEAFGLIEESGIARYWLAPIGDSACAAFDKKSLSSRQTLWLYAGVPYDGRTCLASERVLTATAEFTVNYPSSTTIERGVATIESRRIALTRTGETRPLATLTHFEQVPWNKKYTYWGIPPIPSCPRFVRPVTPINFHPEHLLQMLSGQLQSGEIIK